MSRKIILSILFLFQFSQVKSQSPEPIIIGSKHLIHSEILNENREFWISLPESYEQLGASYKQYPLLILLDGNAHFRSITGMVNYMSSGANGNYRIPEMIVVGIQNVDRMRDFTPDKIITVRENNSGGEDNFLDFLEKELIPELDRQYRTEPFRILYGHSLGGLLATHAYMKENTLFKAFLAVDPSFGTWDADTMDKKLEIIPSLSFDRFIYLATANWDKRNITNRDRHVRFYESLNSKYKGKLRAQLDYFEKENHGSVPVIAFHQGISAIFENYGVSYRDIKTLDQLNLHFQEISNCLSWSILPPEAFVNRIGYTLLQSRDKIEKSNALNFFILNTTNFPGSYNAFDSLGEAYEILEHQEKALENYQKSLALNPENQHAQMKIRDLIKDQ